MKVFGVPITETDRKAAWDKIVKESLPEVLFSPYVGHEQEHQDWIDQHDHVRDAGAAAQRPSLFEWLDKEPFVVEGAMEKQTYQDAIVKQVFNGDEAAYGSWLNDHGAAYRNAHMGGLALFDTAVQPSWMLAFNKWANIPFEAAQKGVAKVVAKAAEKSPTVGKVAEKVTKIARSEERRVGKQCRYRW